MKPNTESALSHSSYAYASSYEDLLRRLRRREQLKRMVRFIRDPGSPMLRRMGLKEPSGPVQWQSRFADFAGWSAETAAQLRKLTPDFITAYSLEPDSAHWLYEMLRRGTHKTIIECGCGISTVIIALATWDRKVEFLSLEQDEAWLEKTRQALVTLGLSTRVKLLYAPLKRFEFAGGTFQAHDASVLATTLADLLLVDAPPGNLGRAGVLPALRSNLSPEATILLDDASRPGEEECVKSWVRNGLAIRVVYVVVGLGVAVLAKQ